MELLEKPMIEQRRGFRLQRLEIYNWGTFNGEVWTVVPDGSTALLTGANGSGKSTLVDALLTLLVPRGKRTYNQASGADKRKERDETSYVRGAYGRIKDEENNRGVTQYLRDRGAYAVLLACFADERQALSIAQIFFWQGDELKNMYIVAPRSLRIAEDLRITSTHDELRKRLRASGADVHDEVGRYRRQLIKAFGLRSEKALDLFNQTVSIKEIGGLNDFVRQHMLERTDAGEKITQLRETYQNLTRAHDAIVKAEAQLERLNPLLAEADQHDQLQERIAIAERCGALVPPYIARRKLDMLVRAIDAASAQIDEQRSRADALQSELDALRQQERVLFAAITNDSVGQQLQQLREAIERINEQKRAKKKQADIYNDTARKLQFQLYSDSDTFFKMRKQAHTALVPLDKRMQALVQERDTRKQEEGRLRAVCQELERELASLRGRTSGIPDSDIRIRAELSRTLGLAEADLPFVGELLKVRDNARPWEGAIERLLRGYGRHLLVPEAEYPQVRGYVDATNLRGRLVYHRVDPRRVPRSTVADDDALIGKLEIKPDSDFHDWLKADLLEQWDFVCCTTLEQFGRERRAVTQNGQIKRGAAQYEKDDRFKLGDRTQYLLGWDNRAKIDALEGDLRLQQRALKQVKDAISALEEEQKQRDKQRTLLYDLLRYDDFAAIDWQSEELRLHDLTEQLRILEASSDRLAQLQTQLKEIETQIKTLEGDAKRAEIIIGTLKKDIERYERGRAESAQKLQAVPIEALNAHAALIDAEIKGRTVTIETVDSVEKEVERFFNQSASNLRGRATTLSGAIQVRMVNFKRDYPEDTVEMDAAIESVGEFRRMHARIASDDLPTHRKRFKTWMEGKVGDAIIGFQNALDTRMDEYRESIDALNGALRTIAYTNATYINLTADTNRDREIQEFRHTLLACIPNVGQRTPEANEATFQQIRALIGRFEKEERWTEKVTDVRNWLDFAAEERYVEDNSVKNYYSDSSGKSGGQKAKLAYTILASAIAYQYGLTQDEVQPRTFRFVVVDEAFSKSDENNARYAMDLFKQLNLQLLVVTPLDKTHIVEQYINACHFVTNTPEENNSQVFNLTIEQYHAQKDRFAALAKATL